jgi:hypothetical protein
VVKQIFKETHLITENFSKQCTGHLARRSSKPFSTLTSFGRWAAITAFKATQVAHWICAQMHAHELDCIKKLRSIPELAHEVSMARIATNAAPIGK